MDIATLEYEFCGNDVGRYPFIRSFIEKVLDLTGPSDGQPLIQLLLEIVKNIYDHADGKGCAALVKRGRIIEFEVIDLGTQSFDLAEIKRRGSTKAGQPGNRENFGCGLCGGMIQSMAATLKVDLVIDTSCGFGYRGVYDPTKFRH